MEILARFIAGNISGSAVVKLMRARAVAIGTGNGSDSVER